MKIIISYESKWSVSLADPVTHVPKFVSVGSLGEATEKIPNYIDSSESTEDVYKRMNSNYKNFDYKAISLDTVNGVIARLLGEIRYMSDALKDKDHIMHNLKDKISFEIKNRDFYTETMQLHTPLKDSQSNGQGVVTKNKDSLFLSKNNFSNLIFSIFNITDKKDLKTVIDLMYSQNDIDDILKYIEIKGYLENKISLTTFIQSFQKFQKRFEFLDNNYKKYASGKNYDLDDYNLYDDMLKNLSLINSQTNNMFTSIQYRSFAGILVYSVANYMINNNHMANDVKTKVFNKSGNIVGLASLKAKSPGSITTKDFYNNFAEKKISHTSPYIFSVEYFKKTGEKNDFNTKNDLGIAKEDGVLEITIDVPYEEAVQLKEQINNAAVSVFQMGKKGLAYVKRIEL